MAKKPTYEELEQRIKSLESESLACKQAEDALRESKDKFRALFEFAPDAYYLNNLEGYFIDGNKAAELLLGYKKEELIGKNFLEMNLLPPEQLPKAAKLLKMNIEGQTTGPNELILNRKDGSQVLLEISTIMTKIKGQDVVLGIARDMTERKQIEEALKKSEYRYRTLIGTMNEGLVEVDENWAMTFVNDRFANMMGYSREQLIGRRFYEFASEAYKAKAQKEHTRRRQGKAASYELELVRSNGEKNFMFCSPRPSYDSEGNYLGSLGVVTDITTRKEMEEQLRVSDEKYRFLAEHMEDIVWTLDRNFRTTYVSPSVEKALGFTQDERKQQSIQETVTPESLQEIQKMFMQELQHDKEDGVDLDRSIIIEVEYYHKDGSIVGMENRVQAIRDSKNAIVGIFGVSRDTTKRKQAEEALLRAQKLESLGVLAGGIAHDFNNLMSAVLGNISLARIEMSPGSKGFKNLVEAEKASIQTKELTARLVTFSEGGGPVKETVSIRNLVKDSVDSSLKGSDISCRFSIPDDISPAEVDEEQMKQVIRSIITNAQEAMVWQGTINVSCENVNIGEKNTLTLKDGKYVTISIEDQGPGIPKRDLANIFDPYFSTKDVGTQKGMGLGLAVSDSIVKKHDGLITVESESETGTTFCIYLPASKKEIEEASPLKKPVPEKLVTQRKKILVMDDEELVRNVTHALLTYIGYKVGVAADGVEAIGMYRKAMGSGKPYDLVILDLTNNFGMGGVETIKRLLKIDPDVKALIATGYSNDPIINNYRKHGFRSSLSKPFSMDELKTALRDAIAEK